MLRPALLDAVLEQTATRFLRRIHRVTHRMPLKLRPITRQRVVIVAPHPDDEVIAAGGTLALHQRASSEMTAIFVTIDPPDASGEVVRRGEAAEAARLLGYDCRFLEYPDRYVSHHEDAVGRDIGDIVGALRPDVVFCPFPGDHHRDHQAAAASTAIALERSRFAGEVWLYEVWSTLWPNAAVDISTVVEAKRAAIASYRSQTAGVPWAEAALGLNRFRGVKACVPYAETFYVCSTREFQDLCRTLAGV